MAILYKANETDFSHLGLGTLNDAISILVTEERNGVFELEMKYPVSGQAFSELKNDRLIKADAGHNLKDQRFKIIRITKPLKGIVTVYAEHISYLSQDLALEPKVNFSGNAQQALNKWKSSLLDDNPFIVSSDITTTGQGTWTINNVENPRRALGGVSGSILDVYGGEYLFDNYQIRLMKQRGVNSATLIAYGRNLVDLTQEEEIANTYTSIYPYSVYTDDGGEQQLLTLPEYFIDSEYVDNFARRKILAVDFSNDEIKTVSALRSATNQYIKANKVGIPKVNLKLEYIDLAKTLDYKDKAVLEEVNLCDNVPVYFEKFDINTTAKVIKTVWDELKQEYDSLEIGEARSSLTQSISATIDGKVEKVEKQINEVQLQADGIKLIYRQQEEPPPGSHVGDLWYQPNGIYEIMYQWDGAMWKEVINTQDLDVVKRDVDQALEDSQTAKNTADQSVATANLASQNAVEAINQAQDAFDDAQLALTTAQGLTNRMSSVEGDISTLSQTTQSFATRIENAEGDISTLTQTSQGLQTRVADAEDNITSVTQLATGMQTRLTNAEGSINTLTTTASSLESTISSVRDDLDGLEIGGRNLQPDTSDEYKTVMWDNWNAYPNYTLVEIPVIPGGFYTASVYYKDVETSDGVDVGLRLFWRLEDGTRQESSNSDTSVKVGGEGYATITRKAPANARGVEVVLRKYSRGGSGRAKYRWVKLEKGTKATDWSPAPEDMATQSQFTQLSDNINLRVMKDDIINQINISTEDILISGKKLILDGDTTVTGTFKVSNANITSVDAGKMTTGTLDAGQVNIINLNASNIKSGTLDAIDITGGRITQQSSGGRVEMYNGKIQSYRRDELAIEITGYQMKFYNSDNTEIGTIRPITSLVTGEKGIGFGVGDESRIGIGVDIDGVLYPSLEINPLTNRTYLAGAYNKLGEGSSLSLYANRRPLSAANDYNATDQPTIILDQSKTTNDLIMYYGGLNRRNNSIFQVRHNFEADSWRSMLTVDKSGLTTRYGVTVKNAGSLNGGFKFVVNGNEHIITGHSKTSNMIIYPQRMTDQDIFRVRSHHQQGNFRNDLRIRYNGDIEGKKFVDSSLAETKENIKKWDCNALDIINQSDLYEWTRGSDKKEYGFVIGEGYKTPEEVISESGSGISNYSHRSLNTKAIQELDTKVNKYMESTALKFAELEQRLQKLEVA